MSQPTEDRITAAPLDPRYARLADAAQRVAESHAIFIAEHADPGTEALAAQYVLRQELLWHDMAGEPDAVIRIAEVELRLKVVAEAIDREDLKWLAITSEEEVEAFAAAVVAVVQPEINQRDAEIRRLRAELARATTPPSGTLPVRQKCTPGELRLLDEWMQDHGDDPGAWPEAVRLAYANTVAHARAAGTL